MTTESQYYGPYGSAPARVAMVRAWRESGSQPIDFDELAVVGSGGEARVLAVPNEPGMVAKIYRESNAETYEKLHVMRREPPDGFAEAMARVPRPPVDVAWPVELLFSAPARTAESFAGFLMPRAVDARPIMDVYNPAIRRRTQPAFDYRYLLRTARNLAVAVNRLHERGIVIGDINESNVFVTESAIVTLIDADSFQWRDAGTNRLFPCRVGKPDYTPPELQQRHFGEIVREETADRFGLAVLIFQLLMEGTHPFAGVSQLTEPPPLGERILHGWYAFDGGAENLPMPGSPPIALLPPPVREMMAQCFVAGHLRPDWRPTAGEWGEALTVAHAECVRCERNARHIFGPHLADCPWCERTEKFGGRDPFPTAEMLRQEANPIVSVTLAVRDAETAGASSGASLRLTTGASASRSRGRSGLPVARSNGAFMRPRECLFSCLAAIFSVVMALATVVLGASVVVGVLTPEPRRKLPADRPPDGVANPAPPAETHREPQLVVLGSESGNTPFFVHFSIRHVDADATVIWHIAGEPAVKGGRDLRHEFSAAGVYGVNAVVISKTTGQITKTNTVRIEVASR